MDQVLSNNSLAWMIDHCRPYLSFLPAYLTLVVMLHQNPNERSTRRAKGKNLFDCDYQGWAKGRLYDSYYESLYTVQAQGWRYRRPGEYGAKEGAEGRSVGTRETIHPSVRKRWTATLEPLYRPESLNGLVPRQKATGKWEWVRKGKGGQPDLVIDEDDFREKDSFQAQLRHPVEH